MTAEVCWPKQGGRPMYQYPWGKRYKRTFACWTCRKVFKRRDERRITADAPATERGLDWHCPECRELMEEVGFAFEAPPRHRIKEWLARRQASLRSKVATALR